MTFSSPHRLIEVGTSPKHLQLGAFCQPLPLPSSQTAVDWCGRLAVVSSNFMKPRALTPTSTPSCTFHLPSEAHAIHLSTDACFHTGFPWAMRCGASM